jgi:UMF1 family MFS transporter
MIAVTTDITNNQRLGITPLIALFCIGLIMLIWVKPNGESA